MSNADKRTVATDALETLGAIIDETAGRDAIHLAVEPVIAAHTLRPGDHVGLLSGGKAGASETPVGIVDPFLGRTVQPGERFWLVVYPRQITSLRHVWTHPAFGDAVEPAAKPVDDPAADSKKWLENFAESVDVTYSQLMRSAERWVDCGDYTVFDYDYHEDIPDEFWSHYERVTGTEVAEDDRGSFFTCSC